MATDLEIAFTKLKNKQERYNLLWKYYDGEQPLVYSTRRLRDAFQDINARFSQNWCAIVIDCAADRIALKELGVSSDKGSTKRLNELFDSTDLDLDADDVHKAAMVCGEAFVIAWKDDKGNTEAYYNDPRLVHIEYDKASPKKKRVAAKWWKDDDDKWHMTLYYADRLEYYVTSNAYKSAGDITSVAAFTADEPDTSPNEYGEIPVFHYRTESRKIKSDLVNVIEPQDAVNKLTADMMVTSEFNAFRQRWVVTNADTKNMKSSPKTTQKIPANDGMGEPTQVGQFEVSEPGTYLEPIDKFASFIAIVSRTPKHYLFSQGGDPSGEALIAMEAPLNKRVSHHIKRFEATWRDVGAFLLKLEGIEVAQRDIQPVFERPETVQPKTQAEIREINTRSEIPLKTSLRWEGKSEEEIAQVEKEKEEDDAKRQSSLGEALLNAQRQFDQGEQAAAGDGGPPQTMPQPMRAPSKV